MKGVILGIHPSATLVDLSHQIPPQDTGTAGFQLAMAYPYFPPGTIHLVVVDPGVGSQREAIAIDMGNAILVGPDNGVFSAVLKDKRPRSAVKLDCPDYWISQSPSRTFHGRDIFAPVAAHLSKGVAFADVGSPVSCDRFVPYDVEDRQPAQQGQIQVIDHFGNLITDISGIYLDQQSDWAIAYQGHLIKGFSTYSAVEPGEAIALIGSHGFVEIAINQGHAQDHFQAALRESVCLVFPT